MYVISLHLRYQGRWILIKNGQNFFFAVQIEKTEINILEKMGKKVSFYRGPAEGWNRS